MAWRTLNWFKQVKKPLARRPRDEQERFSGRILPDAVAMAKVSYWDGNPFSLLPFFYLPAVQRTEV